MTYHTDNKIRKYVKGYGFMSFAKKFGSKRIKDSASSLEEEIIIPPDKRQQIIKNLRLF